MTTETATVTPESVAQELLQEIHRILTNCNASSPGQENILSLAQAWATIAQTQASVTSWSDL